MGMRAILGWLSLGLACTGFGCSGSTDSTECCMMRTIADRCDQSNASQSLRESVASWRSTGEKQDQAACKAILDSSIVGCSGGSGSGYTEPEAAAACAGTTK
jgi:hypothetical protein